MRLSPEQSELVNLAPSIRQMYALHFASMGIRVFPLKPEGKTPADSGWADQATSDKATINRWFDSRPNMNYGIACGPSGLLVVDLDVKNGIDGISNWKTASAGIENISTFEVRTPSGGMHLYFWGKDLRNSAGTIDKGIDLRASGGYVVGPGSELQSGTYFSGLPWHFPDTNEITTASESLLGLLKSRKASESLSAERVLTAPRVPVSKPISDEDRLRFGDAILEIISAGEGTRNDTLNKSSFEVGTLISHGLIPEDVGRRTLMNLGQQIGLEKSEILGTVNSGILGGMLKASETPSWSGSFEPFNLSTWFSTEHKEPKRFGSGDVLTESSLIWLVGEPASGKSFLCMVWAIDVMHQGGKVIWVDEEAGPRDTLRKFQALGATVDLLQENLNYFAPDARNFSQLSKEFHAVVQDAKPTLIVLDSAAAILSNSMVAEDSNSEVSTFVAKVLLPLAKKMQITTVVIDHKTKNAGATRYARGAGAKLALSDMSLNLSVKEDFSKTKDGRIEIEISKDRNGDLTSGWSKSIEVLTQKSPMKMVFSDDWVEPGTRSVAVSPREMKQRLLDFVADNPTCSRSKLEKVPGVKNETKRLYIDEMVKDGILDVSVSGRRVPTKWVQAS